MAEEEPNVLKANKNGPANQHFNWFGGEVSQLLSRGMEETANFSDKQKYQDKGQ